MSAYVAKNAVTPKLRVYDKHGTAHVRTLGTSDPAEIPEVEAFVKRMRKQRRWDTLEAIIARQLTCADAYRADAAGALGGILMDLAALRARDAEPDLSVLVDEYVTDPKYRKQIRRFIPDGKRFPVSDFTRKQIATFLRTLTQVSRVKGSTKPGPAASAATKQRYRAAISCFAKALVENEYLEHNPMREIATPRQSQAAKPVIFHEPADVRRIVEGLPQPYQALEALMAGSGIEFGASAVLRARDVDVETRIVFARGTKNEYRTRYIEVSEDWAWDIVKRHVRQHTPNALLFPIKEWTALKLHQRIEEELGLKRTTLHNHRNSYAVMHLQRGSDHQWLKNQLGHAPQSTLLYTRYGLYLKAAKLTQAQMARLGKPVRATATNRVTTDENLHEVRDAHTA